MVTIPTTDALTDAGVIHAHLTAEGIVVLGVSVTPDWVSIDTEANEETVTAALATLAPPAELPTAEERMAALEAAVLDLLGGV